MDEKVAPLLVCCPQWTTDKEKLANRESRVSPVSKAVHLADWNKAEENKGRWAEMEELSEEAPPYYRGPAVAAVKYASKQHRVSKRAFQLTWPGQYRSR